MAVFPVTIVYGDVHGIRAVLVLRRDTIDHRAIDNRDARTIRDRVRPVW